MIATNIGLVEESSGIGAVLTYTQPLFVFCLAIPFLKERIIAIRLLAAVIGFAGIIVLFLRRIGPTTNSSSFIMVLGAFLWAIAIVYYKKFLSNVDPFVASFFQLSVGALPLGVLSLITKGFFFPRDTAYLWITLYSGFGSLAIGTTIWLFLLREEDATVLSGSSFTVPAVALLLGWQLMGESISIESILGSALIVLGGILVNLGSQHKMT